MMGNHARHQGGDMDHNEQNEAARKRVLALVEGLSDEQLHRPLGNGWSISAMLGHLAFWERVHIGRLRSAVSAGAGAPAPMPDGLADIINNGELAAWAHLPGRSALALFDAASADANAYIATLGAEVVDTVKA